MLSGNYRPKFADGNKIVYSQGMRARRYVLFRISLVVLIGSLVIHQLRFIARVCRHPSHSFVSYYTASYLLAQGKDVILFYNDFWFRHQVRKITPTIEEYYSPNPPTTALLLLPLAHRTHRDARTIWIVFNVLLVMGAIAGILWREKVSFWRGGIVLLLVLTYQPLWANFAYGQVYGLLFVVMTLIWYALVHRRDRLAGGLLGIIWVIKTAGLFLFLLLLVKRRWQALRSSIAVISLIVIVSLPMLGGISTWRSYINRVVEYSQRPALSVTAYQSISGFFKHHLIYDPTWNPSPLIHAPLLATLLSFTLMLALVTITLFRSKRDPSTRATFCALIIVGVIVSPVSVDYHFTLLLLPIFLLLVGHPRMTVWQTIGFMIAVGLLAVDYPYQTATHSLSLLAYPKLIGSLILWAVCITARWGDSYQRRLIFSR